MVQFKSATYSVAENGGSLRVYVSRTVGSDGAASVDYATANATAMSGSDYTAKSGTLNWAAGDSTDKYFDVSIIDDNASESSETFKVNLSNATGAALGTPSTTTVTINGPNDAKANLRIGRIGEGYNVKPGDKVNIKGTIWNDGQVSAGPANHRIYLLLEEASSGCRDSYDNTGRRTKLLETFSSPSIIANGKYDFSIPVTIPGNLTPGWDFLAIVELDYDNQVDEIYEQSTACGDNYSGYPLFGDPWAVAVNFALRNKSSISGDPVNTSTGNFVENKQDLFLRGRGLDINFTRYYNSLAGLDSPIGHSWNHSYNVYINADVKNGTKTGNLTVVLGDGRRITYAPNAAGGGYAPVAKGVYERLTKNTDGTYTLTQKDQVKYNFNTDNKLSTIVDRNGNTVTLVYTGNNLTQISDTVGRTVTLTYENLAGLDRITSIKGPVRPAVTYGYDSYGYGNLTSVTDARGYTTHYTYTSGHDDKHLLEKITDPRGHDRVRNFYGKANGTEDPHGYFVVRQLDANTEGTRYVYDVANRVTSVTGPDLKVTKHYYDDQYRFTKEVDPKGYVLEFQYDADGNRNRVIDKRLNPTIFTYWDDSENVKTKTDAEGAITYIEYNAFNDPTQKVEGYGVHNHTWTYTYDSKGNLKTETDPEGGQVVYEYNAYGQVATRKDQNQKITSYFYEDSWGNLTRVVGPPPTSAETAYSYDAAGRKLTSRDGLGNETTFVYDENDNLLSVLDPEGYKTEYSYDKNGNRATLKNARGYTTTYVYDVKDRLIETVEPPPHGKQTIITYDAFDRKETVKDRWGNVTRYGYDDLGNLTSVINAKTETTQYGYDKNGNRVSMTDADNRVWTYTYDKNNRLLCSQSPATVSARTCNGYKPGDPRGLIETVTDANGKVTRFEYNGMGWLTGVEDPEGGKSAFTYDKAGNRLTEKDARGNTIHYEYDEMNRLRKIIDRNIRETVFTYDSVNRTARRDGNGNTTGYTYYANGWLKTMDYPAPFGSVAFTYDQNGNRKTMVDSLGTTAYSYDELDRLLSVTDPYGQTVSYAYDASVNRRTLTYPGAGKTVVYDYDSLGRVATVADWLGYATSYSYNKTGNIGSVANTKGARVDYAYDVAGRLTDQVDKTSAGAIVSSFHYTLDPLGNRKAATMTLPVSPAFTDMTRSGHYDPENQITSWGAGSYTSDLAGRQATRTEGAATTNYSFNPEDRLTSVADGTDAWQYRYNGLGDRLARVVNGTETRYVLDPGGAMANVLMETDATGAATAYYIHGAGLLYRITPAGERQQYHFDPVGSTLALTDANEAITDKYAYDPFGRRLNREGTTANPFQYVGRYGVMDEENGLLFMGARFYDTDTKRFLSRDPVKGDEKNTQYMLFYAYGRNNPIRYFDPYGADAVDTSFSIARDILKEVGIDAGKDAIDSLPVDDETKEAAQQANSAGQAGLSAFLNGMWHLNPLFLRKIPALIDKAADPDADLSEGVTRLLWLPDIVITTWIDMLIGKGNHSVSDWWLKVSGYTELYSKPNNNQSSHCSTPDSQGNQVCSMNSYYVPLAGNSSGSAFSSSTKKQYPYKEADAGAERIKYVPNKLSPKTASTGTL